MSGLLKDRDQEVSRLTRNAVVALLGMAAVGAAFWTWSGVISLLIGGVLALINFEWMKLGIDRALGGGPAASAGKAWLAFFFRLVLILGTLFAMIHFSFFSLYGAILGLSIFVLAGSLEAVVLLARNLR